MDIETYRAKKVELEKAVRQHIQRELNAFELETRTTVTGLSVCLDSFVVKHGDATTGVANVDVTVRL